MDVLSLLLSQLKDKEAVTQLSGAVKAKPDQVQKLAEVGLPLLLGALTRNASTQEGAQSLNRAIDQHQDDLKGNVAGFLKNVDTNDGSKILGHILGAKDNDVTNKLAASTGMDVNQVKGLLIQFAPLILAQLGKQKKELGSTTRKDLDASAGLSALLGTNDSSDLMNMAAKFLDADGDGDVMDDVGNMLGKLFK